MSQEELEEKERVRKERKAVADAEARREREDAEKTARARYGSSKPKAKLSTNMSSKFNDLKIYERKKGGSNRPVSRNLLASYNLARRQHNAILNLLVYATADDNVGDYLDQKREDDEKTETECKAAYDKLANDRKEAKPSASDDGTGTGLPGASPPQASSSAADDNPELSKSHERYMKACADHMWWEGFDAKSEAFTEVLKESSARSIVKDLTPGAAKSVLVQYELLDPDAEVPSIFMQLIRWIMANDLIDAGAVAEANPENMRVKYGTSTTATPVLLQRASELSEEAGIGLFTKDVKQKISDAAEHPDDIKKTRAIGNGPIGKGYFFLLGAGALPRSTWWMGQKAGESLPAAMAKRCQSAGKAAARIASNSDALKEAEDSHELKLAWTGDADKIRLGALSKRIRNAILTSTVDASVKQANVLAAAGDSTGPVVKEALDQIANSIGKAMKRSDPDDHKDHGSP